MITKVKDFIAEWGMLDGVQRVVVGVSGGADSVCLLHVLMCLQKVCGQRGKAFSLLALHVHHGIRGAQADRDQRFVEELCAEWGVECRVVKADVPALAVQRKLTQEEAGRWLRYQSFAAAASEQPGSVVAVAHHQEDQAETALFRMVRGTGWDGFAGMRPVTRRADCTVIRPLLCVHRRDIEAYLQEAGIACCEDATNASLEYSRNVIRHELLPVMTKLNPQAVEHVNALTTEARQWMDYINRQVESWIAEYAVQERDWEGRAQSRWRIPAAALRAQPEVMQAQIFRQLLAATEAGQKDIDRRHLRLICGLLVPGAPPMGRVALPGGRQASLCYETLVIGEEQSDTNCENLVNFFRFREILPDKTARIQKKTYTKTIDCAKIRGALVVRFWQPGDFIAIDRQGHHKPLNRYFIAEKIPRDKRNRIPLVCDGSQVVWIVGYRLSPAYYVTEHTQTALEMTFDASKGERDGTEE